MEITKETINVFTFDEDERVALDKELERIFDILSDRPGRKDEVDVEFPLIINFFWNEL